MPNIFKKRASAVRFAFSFKIGTLAPWPTGNKACAIGWQRGSSTKKRGATEAHLPELIPGQLGTAVKFNEVIQMSATLYMEGNGKPSPSGPFKKKCLILAVLETESRGKRTESLGRVVIDLAEFASLQNELTKEFPVACSKTIQAAVGDPKLGVTIRCAWKGASGPGSSGSFASSLSSDATGGTLTSHLSSLIRNGQQNPSPLHNGMTGDQMDELRAFDRLVTINESESEYRTRTSSKSEIILPPQLNGVTEEPGSGGRYDADGFIMDSDDEDLGTKQGKDSKVEVQVIGGPPPPPKGADRISSWLESSLDRENDLQKSGVVEMGEPHRGREGSESNEDSATGISGLSTPARSGEEVLVSPALSEAGENGADPPAAPDVSSSRDRRFVRRVDSLNASDDDRVPTSRRANGDANGAAKPIETATPARRESPARVNYAQVKQQQQLQQPKSPTMATVPPVNTTNDRNSESNHTPKRWRPVHKEPSNLKEVPSGKDISSLLVHSPTSADGRSSSRLDSASYDADVQAQLRSAAFLEASVYLARSGSSQFKSRSIHAPARRIIRTLAALGPEQGKAAVKDAIQAIRSMVKGCGADVSGMAYWWSNCVQMRMLLPQVATGSSRGGSPRKNSVSLRESHWAVKDVSMLLAVLEKEIYNRIEQYLWWKVLLPLVADQGRRGRASPKSESEVAVHRWLDTLHTVHDQFLMSPEGKGTEGHVPVLKNQVLRNFCRRIDAMIFQELMPVQGGDGFRGPQQITAFVDEILGVDPGSLPPLDDCVLPFTRGDLSFGVGMHIKMAVTRWVEWAFKMDVKEDSGQSLFPLLKATADLLMMPKELLTDASVRVDVFSALSTRSMCTLLEHFTPDDFAPDPIDNSVLKNLRSLPQSQPDESQSIHLMYDPPSDHPDPQSKIELTSSSRSINSRQSTASSTEDNPLSFEFDSVSEDDLDSLSTLYEGETKEAPSRFKFLKDLWIEKRDRRLGRGSR